LLRLRLLVAVRGAGLHIPAGGSEGGSQMRKIAQRGSGVVIDDESPFMIP